MLVVLSGAVQVRLDGFRVTVAKLGHEVPETHSKNRSVHREGPAHVVSDELAESSIAQGRLQEWA